MPRPLAPAPDKAAYLRFDTIAAIASAVGGAIAVVRLSGPESTRILTQLSSGTPGVASAEERVLKRVALRHNHEPIDDALVVRYAAPRSYTGEESVEFFIHGGAWVAERLLEALCALGARQALPGEFSFRAIRNGKLTLTQAQAVTDLIAASNDGAARLALEKLSGSQHRLIANLAEQLRTTLTLAEAGIDFSDQDLEEVSLPALKRRVLETLALLHQLERGYSRGVRLQDGVRLAIAGLPNAGKSTFFNALLGEDRSIVSEIPGTTRDSIRERFTLRGPRQSFTLRLEDTAGLRASQDPIEKQGVERAHAAATAADLGIFLVDPTQPLEASLLAWRELLRSGIRPEAWVTLFSKSDVFSDTPTLPVLSTEADRELPSLRVSFSARTGAGLEAVTAALLERCAALTARATGEVLLTRVDHHRAVITAISGLTRASETTELDLFAADLRSALHALTPLVGETVPDDILGRIFSEFCIGK